MYKDILYNWNFNPIGCGYWILTKDIYFKDCGDVLVLTNSKTTHVLEPSVFEAIVKSFGEECTFDQFYEALVHDGTNIMHELAMNLYRDREEFINNSVEIFKDKNNRIQVIFDKYQVCRIELFDTYFLITADHELVDDDKNILYSFFYQTQLNRDADYEEFKYYINSLYEKFKIFYDKYLSL